MVVEALMAAACTYYAIRAIKLTEPNLESVLTSIAAMAIIAVCWLIVLV